MSGGVRVSTLNHLEEPGVEPKSTGLRLITTQPEIPYVDGLLGKQVRVFSIQLTFDRASCLDFQKIDLTPDAFIELLSREGGKKIDLLSFLIGIKRVSLLKIFLDYGLPSLAPEENKKINQELLHKSPPHEKASHFLFSPWVLPLICDYRESFEVLVPYLDPDQMDWAQSDLFSNAQTLLHYVLTYCDDLLVLSVLKLVASQKDPYRMGSLALPVTEANSGLDTRILCYAAKRSVIVFKFFLDHIFREDPRLYNLESLTLTDENLIVWAMYQTRFFHQIASKTGFSWFPAEKAQDVFLRFTPERLLSLGASVLMLNQLASDVAENPINQRLPLLGLLILLEDPAAFQLEIMKSSNPLALLLSDILPNKIAGLSCSLLELMVRFSSLEVFQDSLVALLETAPAFLRCLSEKEILDTFSRGIILTSRFQKEEWLPFYLSYLPESQKQDPCFLAKLLTQGIQSGQISCRAVQCLIDLGTDPFVVSDSGLNAFDLLTRQSKVLNVSIFEILLDRFASKMEVQHLARALAWVLMMPESKHKTQLLPKIMVALESLMRADLEGYPLEGQEYLVRVKEFNLGITLIHCRLIRGDQTVLALLTRDKPLLLSLLNVSMMGESLLHLAVRSGNAELVSGLLKLLPIELRSPLVWNAVGYSALGLACVDPAKRSVLLPLLLQSLESHEALNLSLSSRQDTLPHFLALVDDEIFTPCLITLGESLDWNKPNKEGRTAFGILTLMEKNFGRALQILNYLDSLSSLGRQPKYPVDLEMDQGEGFGIRELVMARYFSLAAGGEQELEFVRYLLAHPIKTKSEGAKQLAVPVDTKVQEIAALKKEVESLKAALDLLDLEGKASAKKSKSKAAEITSAELGELKKLREEVGVLRKEVQASREARALEAKKISAFGEIEKSLARLEAEKSELLKIQGEKELEIGQLKAALATEAGKLRKSVWETEQAKLDNLPARKIIEGQKKELARLNQTIKNLKQQLQERDLKLQSSEISSGMEAPRYCGPASYYPGYAGPVPSVPVAPPAWPPMGVMPPVYAAPTAGVFRFSGAQPMPQPMAQPMPPPGVWVMMPRPFAGPSYF